MGTASIQLRFSTERPEVYDVESSVKFDPSEKHTDYESFISKVESLKNTNWEQPFGDGTASDKIVQDLVNLSDTDSFKKHATSDYPFDISNSLKG